MARCFVYTTTHIFHVACSHPCSPAHIHTTLINRAKSQENKYLYFADLVIRTKFFGSVASFNKFSTVISTVVTTSFGSSLVVACNPLSLFDMIANAPRASALRASSSRRAFASFVSFVSFRPVAIALRCSGMQCQFARSRLHITQVLTLLT